MGLTAERFLYSRAAKQREKRENPLGLSSAGSDSDVALCARNGEFSKNGKTLSTRDTRIENENLKLCGSGVSEEKSVFSTREIILQKEFVIKVNKEKQSKHIVGSSYYRKGRSVFYGTAEDADKLIKEFGGKGEMIGRGRERVDFGVIIGEYINLRDEKGVPTTMGIIHYSKNGSHIVPSNPVKQGGIK